MSMTTKQHDYLMSLARRNTERFRELAAEAGLKTSFNGQPKSLENIGKQLWGLDISDASAMIDALKA